MAETCIGCCDSESSARPSLQCAGVLGRLHLVVTGVSQRHIFDSKRSSFWSERFGLVDSRSRSVSNSRWNLRQHFDCDHAAAIAIRTFQQRAACEPLISISVVLLWRRLGRAFLSRSHSKKLAATLQLIFAVWIAEEPVVANAVEPASACLASAVGNPRGPAKLSPL
jgi:hypothetical protein